MINNPFEVISPGKFEVGEEEGEVALKRISSLKVGGELTISQSAMQASPNPILTSPSKRGRKPKNSKTQQEIDVGIQSTLISP